MSFGVTRLMQCCSSAAASRQFWQATMAPMRAAASCSSRYSVRFSDSNATRSPCATPCWRSKVATRQTRRVEFAVGQPTAHFPRPPAPRDRIAPASETAHRPKAGPSGRCRSRLVDSLKPAALPTRPHLPSPSEPPSSRASSSVDHSRRYASSRVYLCRETLEPAGDLARFARHGHCRAEARPASPSPR